MHPLDLQQPGATVLAVGAHADDIEIGAGGTLLRLRAAHPDVRLVWLVLSAPGARGAEARAAALAFGADDVWVADFPDRFFPAHWEPLKRRIADAAAELARCDLVLGPWAGDQHQDHRTTAEILVQVFRRQPVWSYEIVKYEGDLGQPNLLVELSDELATTKVDRLLESFPSQHDRTWCDRTTLLAIMRLRGVQAATPWAEGFHARPIVW